MPIDNQTWILAEAQLAGKLTPEEQAALQSRMATDPAFAETYKECLNLLASVTASGKHQQMRAMLKDIHKEVVAPANAPKKDNTIPLRLHYFRTAAVAAGIALLTSFTTYSFLNHPDKKTSSQYNVLRRELENIKRSQNQLIQHINQKSAAPASAVKYTGTGFAISNDGYLATNYHVAEGADSIYIQAHDGQYYKAAVIFYDVKSDIAILKVQDEDFRFGKGEVPYTFAPSKAGLGSKVFTLGFPDDEIVFNEGYISAKNGFQNDSLQYRLELPADPGQSGAPVLDNAGNVLAIVTARGNRNEGNTYAVSSKALLALVAELPKELGVHLPKVNRLSHLKREQQIKKLESYTCSVKVYKK